MNDEEKLALALAAKSDQLNADDLIGGPKTITVTKVTIQGKEQPITINYQGDDGKPYKPCKTMGRIMQHFWSSNPAKWIGRSMTLFRDPKVVYAGQAVGGIRISHMSHINGDQVTSVTLTRGKKTPYTVRELKVESKAPEPVATSPASEQTLEEGLAAAKGGVEHYSKWLAGLDEETKSTIKHKHKEWSAMARAADADEELPL